MQVSTAPPELEIDDICFAQTACNKLAKLLQGTLSVGLPSMSTGFPDARSFFEESFRVMEAYATVLHTIGGKASATELILELRRYSTQLENEIKRLHAELLGALRPGYNAADRFRAARDAASRVCDHLAAYSHLLGKDLPLFSEVKALSLRLFDCVSQMGHAPQS
jgi:hypothetical protein